MGSTLYLGTSPEGLAGRLADLVEEEGRRVGLDPFAPISLVLPNRYLAKWLRLWLARRLGVVVNFRFHFLLETALWNLLARLDPRDDSRPTMLDRDRFQLLVLSALLDAAADADLAPLHDYLRRDGRSSRRDFHRRAWQLADRLAGLLRDYEYHRQDMIRRWSEDAPAADLAPLERSQRALYRRIMSQPHGLRACLSDRLGQRLLTLPHYAAEVMALPSLRPPDPSQRMIHLFGLTQFSMLHARVIHWLGQHYDLRLYHINPLVARTKLSAAGLEVDEESPARKEGSLDLLSAWGRAGVESLRVAQELLRRPAFQVERVADEPRSAEAGVLACLQDDVLGRASPPARLPQDTSLQIVACPGIFREVETVYQSILHNLETRPDLRQTDVAVLVADMPRYRPVLQAVFERQPRHLAYNLADFSAANLSVFGHALVGMLDLAQESFTRSRVMDVLLNPCFLARLGVDRQQALTWLNWAEQLGIYRGWDQHDQQQRGYRSSPLYGWKLGLQRLRLGRLMHAADADDGAPAPRFAHVIPFADLTSGDRDQLDAFCRAVERLLPRLQQLRQLSAPGRRWAFELRRLVDDFLAPPDDRQQAESEVRDRLLESLDHLEWFDDMAEGERTLPLSLVREFAQGALEQVEGTRGEYLTGGVTISALQPLRPVPFRLVYLLGLGEGNFPGADRLSSLDLRDRQPRLPGDILPGESNRFLLLEALLAARDKLYLLYPSRELQKDQPLYPCGPLIQLRRYLEERILAGPFQPAEVPLLPSDPTYLAPNPPAHTDVLVNYAMTDRLLALAEVCRQEALPRKEPGVAEVERRLAEAERTFALPAGTPPQWDEVPTVRLRDLAAFLRCPAEAALQRHLHLYDDDEIEPADDEPFFTGRPHDFRLESCFLQRFIRRAAEQSVRRALEHWTRDLAELHDEWRLRGRVPEGPFADVDQARFERRLERRLLGRDGLAVFLRRRTNSEFCGPILLGDSPTPIGARQHFPPLQLDLGNGFPGLPAAVRLSGSTAYAWRNDRYLDLLVLTLSSKLSDRELSLPMLEPLLFWLALRCQPDAAEWLGTRRLRLYLTGEDNLIRFCYSPERITLSLAADYLRARVREFFDRSAFDLLPFALVLNHRDLAIPYHFRDLDRLLGYYRRQPGQPTGLNDDDLLDHLRRDYFERFQSALAEEAESDHPSYRPTQLVQMIEPPVPADALDKLQRRFWLLDRGPARRRQADSR